MDFGFCVIRLQKAEYTCPDTFPGGSSMKPSIPYWQTAGFLFVSVMGTFLHFLFDWAGGSILSALVSAVYPMEESMAAFERARSDKTALRVLIDFN